MANQLTALKTDYTRRRQTRRFKIALTGSYVNGTGEVLDFTNILNPEFQGNIAPGFFPPPALADFKVVRAPVGYGAEVVANGANTAPNNAFALKLFSAAGTELASGAYSAGVLADFVVLELNTSTFGG
jgi:hypothetical protein